MSTESFLKLFKHYDSISNIDYTSILSKLNSFESLINDQTLDFENTDYHNHVLDEFRNIREIINNSKLKELNGYFNEIIKRREGNYIKKGYELYENEFRHDSYIDILNAYSQQHIPSETEQYIIGVLGKYTKWQTAGLELSPGHGRFTNKLITCDPLYIVDKHQEILKHVTKQFNEAYRRRLRVYNMKAEANFSMLPESQFGLIFSWGFFEKLPLDIIKDYLKAFYNLLKPGGVCVLSYNNCIFKPSLHLTATNSRAYNTETFMSSIIYGSGFDNITSTNLSPNYSLIEFKKPGEITSCRASQTLGVIKNVEF